VWRSIAERDVWLAAESFDDGTKRIERRKLEMSGDCSFPIAFLARGDAIQNPFQTTSHIEYSH